MRFCIDSYRTRRRLSLAVGFQRRPGDSFIVDLLSYNVSRLSFYVADAVVGSNLRYCWLAQGC